MESEIEIKIDNNHIKDQMNQIDFSDERALGEMFWIF